MSDISDRILNLFEKRGISYGDLSKETGIPKSALQRYATGETVKIPLPRLEAIAKALNTTPAYLMGWEDETPQSPHPDLIPLKHVRFVPVIGTIACGTPVLAQENIMGNTVLPDRVHADFALVCHGDSMKGAGIEDGDTVYVRQQPEVENGEIAVALVDSEATLKRVYVTPDRITLMPENSVYAPLTFVKEEMNDVRIVGKVVAILKMVE